MSLADQLSSYLGRLWGRPVQVLDLTRIPGGASRETYRFDVDVDGERKGLILRRDPVGSLIDTDRRLEFLAYQSFYGRGVPAPEPVALEMAETELERPFFIMGRIDGGKAASPFTVDPYAAHAATIGEQFFSILGTIAKADPVGLPISDVAEMPEPAACWSKELDYWAKVIETDQLHPQPIVWAAIRKLRRNPPPPAQKISVVHGDYRTGNFLHDGEGKIIAILDWEMAHLGDPMEDLGWAIDPLWGHFDPDKVGGMMPRAEALKLWEQVSGLKVDEQALDWWSLFNAVKGQAIWTSSAREYRDSGGKDPVLALSGWYTARRHDKIIADRLASLEGWA